MASNRGPNAVRTTPPASTTHNTEVVGTTSTLAPKVGTDAAAVDDGTTSSANGMTPPQPPPTPTPSDTPPKPPQSKAPSRSSSYYEEAVRSILSPGQRALFFGKGTMGVVLKPTYLAR